jgi:FkbM family methyltransferase
MKTWIRTILHRAGWSVRRYSWTTDGFARRVKMLRAIGAETVIDVGANRGYYAQELRRAGYTGRIISIEPLKDAFAQLAKNARGDARWEVLNSAVGDRNYEAVIHVAANSESSSILPMATAHERSLPDSRPTSSYAVNCSTLDDLVGGMLSARERVFLKIDTQGYEDRVLKGATGVIRQTVLIESELTLVTLYHGQLLFKEMLDLLDGLGFRPVLLEPGFSDPESGHCLQLEGLFASQHLAAVPTDSGLLEAGVHGHGAPRG